MKVVSCDYFSVSDNGILHWFMAPSVKYNSTQIIRIQDYDKGKVSIGHQTEKKVLMGYENSHRRVYKYIVSYSDSRPKLCCMRVHQYAC